MPATRNPPPSRCATRTYALLGDLTGRTVVDAGCGGGRAAAELAGRGARAVGVDLDPEMIAVARERWPAGEFQVGDACGLPLETGSVAGYRADKALHMLDYRARAVAEARRVLAPGGRAVLLGQDWDMIAIDSEQPKTTRRLVDAKAGLVPVAARRPQVPQPAVTPGSPSRPRRCTPACSPTKPRSPCCTGSPTRGAGSPSRPGAPVPTGSSSRCRCSWSPRRG